MNSAVKQSLAVWSNKHQKSNIKGIENTKMYILSLSDLSKISNEEAKTSDGAGADLFEYFKSLIYYKANLL